MKNYPESIENRWDILYRDYPEVYDRFASFDDFESVQDYSTVKNIVDTYGFIFGHRAIERLKATGRTSIKWTFRMHYLELR
jgi:hypothetical protein